MDLEDIKVNVPEEVVGTKGKFEIKKGK
uniref:Uncharacterized protein n=1 Tax=Pithovirus LCDPAC01 TaxID=2506600 RepID=A0A481YMD7_9VIRU|nr:MAG: hypothetical protein LCDPAC01_00360 [Pithovirus LCDPAC01]